MKRLIFIAFVCMIMFGCSAKVTKTQDDTQKNTQADKLSDEKTTSPETQNTEIDIDTTDDEKLLDEDLDVNLDSLDDW